MHTTKIHKKIVFFVHDGTGLGHLIRVIRIAEALSSHFYCILVTGNQESRHLVSSVQVCLLKTIKEFENQNIDNRIVAIEKRKQHVYDILISLKPDALIVDYLPYGKHEELYDFLYKYDCKKYLILRGVLDFPENVQREIQGFQDSHLKQYNTIFFANDFSVFNPLKAYNFLPATCNKIKEVGYISPSWNISLKQQIREERGLKDDDIWVVCSIGGGRIGHKLLQKAVKLVQKNPQLIFDFILGPRNLNKLSNRPVSEQLRIHQKDWYLYQKHISADIVITGGGYNSLVECLCGHAQIIVSPIQIKKGDEQFVHAQALSKKIHLYLLSNLNELELVFQKCIQNISPVQNNLSLNGVQNIVDHVLNDFKDT